MADSADEMFTIKLRGVPLQLSRSQIEADSPGSNFFAASLLGDFMEASNKTLSLDRHAGIFKIILDHLSGYRIFPLDKILLKSYYGDGVSVERALRYLQDDSEYYGLSRLHTLVTEEMERLENGEKQEDVYQEELISLKRYKLELERKRLHLDLNIANRRQGQNLNDQRLEILQTKIDIAGRQLQAAATVAATRQVGSAEYGREERQELEQLTDRLRVFSGYDIMVPHPQEEDWIRNEFQGHASPHQFRLEIPNLPARKESVTTNEGASSDIDISANEAG